MPGQKPIMLAFYGDDFTGSTDALNAITCAGLRTVCFMQPPTPTMMQRYKGLQAIGVAGISRSLQAEEMENELRPVFASFRDLQIPLIHYKTCSTFDSSPEIGSIGKAIDIGQEILSSPYVPIMVGAPALGRYCVFGNLFARAGADPTVYRIDRHPVMSRHPITPMQESDLRIHLSKQTDKTIQLLDVNSIDKPVEEAQADLLQQLALHPDIVLFDTLYSSHLATVGQLISQDAAPDKPQYIVGSSGVEYALAAYWQAQGICKPSPFAQPDAVDQVLLLSGSCSPVTEKQIQHALDQGCVEIPVHTDLLFDPNQVDKECMHVSTQALDLLEQEKSVVIHTAKGPADPRIQSTRRKMQASGMSDLEIKLKSGKIFGEALAKMLQTIVEKKAPRRIGVFGGDTCGYLATFLGIEAVEMIAPLAPGCPLCRMYKSGSPLEKMEIILKGGQLGGEKIFSSLKQGKRVE